VYGLPPPALAGLPRTAAPPDTEYAGGLSVRIGDAGSFSGCTYTVRFGEGDRWMEQIKQSNQLDSALPYGRRYTHGAPGLYAGGLSPLDALRAPVLPPEDVDPPLLTPPPLLPPPPLAARRSETSAFLILVRVCGCSLPPPPPPPPLRLSSLPARCSRLDLRGVEMPGIYILT
jgi:hypothetical protein